MKDSNGFECIKKCNNYIFIFLLIIIFVNKSIAHAENEIKEFTDENVTATLLTFQNIYPDGTEWNYARWKMLTNGGLSDQETPICYRPNINLCKAFNHNFTPACFSTVDCAAFACRLSDGVFGNSECTVHTDISKLKPGDIICYRDPDFEFQHVVIVLYLIDSGYVIAEGNYNGKVKWGREFSNQYIDFSKGKYDEKLEEWHGNFIITRY